MEEFNGTQYFTKLDLRAGYHQVLMDPTCIPMTAFFRTHNGHFEFLVSPLALSTFQVIVKSIFGGYLCRFFLVFSDILVYSKPWEDHLETLIYGILHVKGIQQFFLKAIQADTLLHRRPSRFLGLAGYYRKFVKNYGVIAAPLTSLLGKNSFVWSHETTGSFEERAMTSIPILVLPNFFEPFVVERNASEIGLGVVLQNGQPIAFYS